MLSERKPFHIWLVEKIIEVGNEDGGFGWIVFWVIGLVIMVFIDIFILKSQWSEYLNAYLVFTGLYLLHHGIMRMIQQYVEETN